MTTAARVLCALEELPFAGLEAIVGPYPPLILAPHPDDESLGCGGLIAACCARGTPPIVVIVTDGAGSHPASQSHSPARLRELRAQEARTAVECLGMEPESLVFLGLPDTLAPTGGYLFDKAVRHLVALTNKMHFGAVVASWSHDPHCDHAATDLLARAVARATGLMHLAYPVWGWTLPPDTHLPDEPICGWRLHIGAHIAAKQAAIAAHASQHGGVIQDDPTGFCMPASLLGVFSRPYEVYLKA